MQESENGTPVWPIWLGLFCGVSLGAVIVLGIVVWRLSQRDRSSSTMVPAGVTNALGLNAPPNYGYVFPPMLPELMPAPRSMPMMISDHAGAVPPQRASAARTIKVGPVQTQILRATGTRPWMIWVRTVGPPGKFARFSSSNDMMEGVTVPSGGHQQMILQPGEDLYAASADATTVQVSVSGGEQ